MIKADRERRNVPHGHGQRPDPINIKDLWKEINECTLHMVKLILGSSLEKELLEVLQAARYH